MKPVTRITCPLQILEDRSVPSVVINEVYVNPPGIDDNREFVELRSLTSGQVTHPNLALVEVEGDPTGIGTIASDVHLSGIITGVNGLAILGLNYSTLGSPWDAGIAADTQVGDMMSTLGNDNLTLLLVENYTGLVGQDLDVNNDGVFDVTPWTNILDSVGWYDATVPGGKVYSPAVLTQLTATPDAASRFANRLHPQSTSAWYNGDMLLQGGTPDMTTTYDPTKSSANLPTGAIITPGAPNLNGPPAAPIVLNVNINNGAVQRSLATSMAVMFDQVVNLPANPASAFQLSRRFDNAVIDLNATVDNSTGRTVVNFTFGGPLVVTGSLPDGLFALTIQAAAVSNANGQLDGNANTIGGDNYQLLGTSANRFFRLFGDGDGNGTVNTLDFALFRSVFGTGPSIFDFNNDGLTNATDFAQFRARFGIMI